MEAPVNPFAQDPLLRLVPPLLPPLPHRPTNPRRAPHLRNPPTPLPAHPRTRHRRLHSYNPPSPPYLLLDLPPPRLQPREVATPRPSDPARTPTTPTRTALLHRISPRALQPTECAPGICGSGGGRLVRRRYIGTARQRGECRDIIVPVGAGDQSGAGVHSRPRARVLHKRPTRAPHVSAFGAGSRGNGFPS